MLFFFNWWQSRVSTSGISDATTEAAHHHADAERPIFLTELILLRNSGLSHYLLVFISLLQYVTSQASVYFEEAEKTSSSQKKVFFILVFTEKSLSPVDFQSLLSNLIFKNNFSLNFCSKIAPPKKSK